jgi:hypothetical protein
MQPAIVYSSFTNSTIKSSYNENVYWTLYISRTIQVPRLKFSGEMYTTNLYTETKFQLCQLSRSSFMDLKSQPRNRVFSFLHTSYLGTGREYRSEFFFTSWVEWSLILKKISVLLSQAFVRSRGYKNRFFPKDPLLSHDYLEKCPSTGCRSGPVLKTKLSCSS